MHTARDKKTGEIVDASQLWLIDVVDQLGYECQGCDAIATPCSYLPENTPRPYFRAHHSIGCDIDGEVELIKRAWKQRVSTREGFPGSFPNRLTLQKIRPVADVHGVPGNSTSSGQRNTNVNSQNTVRRNLQWTAQTIRPICRTFINYPHDRDISLDIPGIAPKTYQWVFRRLKYDAIINYPETRIFYAPISLSKTIATDDRLEIQLSYGVWDNNKPANTYRIIILWKDWSPARKRYVSQEVDSARQEYISAKTAGKNDKGWLFFIGQQCTSDTAVFYIEDHRLICCISAEIIYPLKPKQ